MSILIELNSRRAGIRQYQGVVDSYFQQHSHYWREVYQRDTLNALIYRERQSTVLRMVEECGLMEQSCVLEVGCGAGLTTVALAKRGYKVDAIDTVEAMLDLTRQAAMEAGVEARVVPSLNDVCRLTLPSQHFDLVVAMGVVPWLQRPERALMELARVSKPNGYAIVTVDNHWCLNQILDPFCFPGFRAARWKIAAALERFNLRTPTRPRLYRHSIKRTDELLSRAGFHKVKGITLGFGPFTLFRRMLVSDSVGIKLHQELQALAYSQVPVIRSLGTEYVVMARKL